MGDSVPQCRLSGGREKHLAHRHPEHLIHQTLDAFNDGRLPVLEACLALGISRSRLYELRHEWLRAGKRLAGPGSGGNQRGGYPPEAAAFIARYLAECRPHNFAHLADELQRRFSFKRDRATLAAYAARHHPELHTAAKPGPKPRRRWQRSRSGELLQHDTSPHVWWPGAAMLPMALTIDDATRYICQATFLEAETTWAHFRHTRRLIEELGLPDAIYTDGLSVFGNRPPSHDGSELRSQFQRALTTVGIGHIVATDAPAKGKIERRFRYWQDRFPKLCRLENITTRGQAAPLLLDQVAWHNANAHCRTTGKTPIQAMEHAREHKLWSWRPAPPAALLDIAFALYERRRINPDHTVDFLGTPWPVAATARKTVGIIHHPHLRFWVVETLPDHRKPIWPTVLAEYSL